MNNLINKISFARNLRRNQTTAEGVLWRELRNRRLAGIKFRRQQPLGSYVADFVSFEKRLVIEIDGGHHNEDIRREKDNERSKRLEKEGFRVIRFWNNEITSNMNGVLEVIKSNLV